MEPSAQNRRASRVAVAATMGFLAMTGLPSAHLHAAEPGGHVPDTESHPPPPSIQPDTPAARAAALAFGTEETTDKVSAAVVTHAVYARIAGDEEWRARFGTAWKSQANAAMERADNEMSVQFGIDFRVYAYWAWDSADSRRSICTILGELDAEVPVSSADVVVGYVDNAMDGSSYGCATTDNLIVKWHGADNTWKTSQHEFSHFFSAPDRYPDPDNNHPDDGMENHYTTPDYWCRNIVFSDWGYVNSSSDLYD